MGGPTRARAEIDDLAEEFAPLGVLRGMIQLAFDCVSALA